MMQPIPFSELTRTDLLVDQVYEGRRNGNAGDDPLPALLGVSNQGGFRMLGIREKPRLVVLTTGLNDPEWPDYLDDETGIFTYYGDNKKPGRELHDTPRFGNMLLKSLFDAIHTGNRGDVPPILVFASVGRYRDMIFKGVVVPGVANLSALHDLVAVWKVTRGRRFQNYRAKFTILDVPKIHRNWLDEIRNGGDLLDQSPVAWHHWLTTGKYRPLTAVRSLDIRSRAEQLPKGADTALLKAILDKYVSCPHAFEACAAEIVRLFLGESVGAIELTRPVRDGGRDATGQYFIGTGCSSVVVGFSLEAKCYDPANTVGVREMSRLISRLRHRQFGVLVTTSWVNAQAYTEVKEDGHPVVFITGGDIIRILKENGISTLGSICAWLDTIGCSSP